MDASLFNLSLLGLSLLAGLAGGMAAPLIRDWIKGKPDAAPAAQKDNVFASGIPGFGPLQVLSGIRVADVMTQVPAVAPADSLDSVQEVMFACEIFALPVLNEDCELGGIISMSDIMKVDRSERANVRVAAVYTREVQAAFPDQTIHEVVERMRERHLANMPVVSRREEKKLLGMVTKADIVRAYRQVAIGNAVGS